MAAIEPPSFATGGASSSLSPFNCRKNVSSALIGPVLFSDGIQRNCSGFEKVTPVGVRATKACGIWSPMATPTVGSAPEQQLSKYFPSQPSLSLRSASDAVCQISVERKWERFGFG